MKQMKACGIAAEYNPFHNGHKYQIEQIRKNSDATTIIAVMSGNWTQRGEPAIVDKWMRAEAAIANGADIIAELPYLFAAQSASVFATGAVKMLSLAHADQMCFGSECGNLDNLQDIADTPVNPDHLRESLSSGMSYPKAYSLLTADMQPNDILAVCYLRQLRDTSIEPLLIQRTGGYLDPQMKENASAYAIRSALAKKQPIDYATPMHASLNGSFQSFSELYYPYLRTLLLTTPRSELEKLLLFSEGIEKHLAIHAAENDTYSGFLNACTNYRYTASRIRRCCLQAMNHITKEKVSKLPEADTLRILVFNDTGRAYLKQLKKTGVRIASRFADIPYPWRTMEYQTSLMYASVFPPDDRRRILDREIGGAMYIPGSHE